MKEKTYKTCIDFNTKQLYVELAGSIWRIVKIYCELCLPWNYATLHIHVDQILSLPSIPSHECRTKLSLELPRGRQSLFQHCTTREQ